MKNCGRNIKNWRRLSMPSSTVRIFRRRNSRKYSPTFQTLLQNDGVPPDEATNIVNDLKAIATETQ